LALADHCARLQILFTYLLTPESSRETGAVRREEEQIKFKKLSVYFNEI